MPTIEELNGGFDLGEWEVLPAQGLLRRGEDEIHPEPRVFEVLLALAQRDGDVVSQDELIAEVWQGRAFNNEPIQRCIAHLRKHFGDARPFEYIENLPRRGYRLMKPVHLHAMRDAAQPEGAAGTGRVWHPGRIVALVVAGLLAVAAYTWWAALQPPAVNSLAIVPLRNHTGDPTRQYIVDGVRDILAQRLSELDEFTIKNIATPVSGDWQKISRDFDVESILHGSVHEQRGVLKLVYEIVDGRDGVIIGAGEVHGHVDDLFEFQETLAAAVRDDLAGGQTPELITRPAPNRSAHRIFMRGMHALEHRGEGSNLEYSIGFFEESIQLDESYGPPYLGLATALALMPDYRGEDVGIFLERAVDTIEKGVRMDPSIAQAAGAIYGFVYHQRKEWREAEINYERAVGARVVDSNAFSWYSRMLASVGRLDEALDMALKAERIDPNGSIVNSRIAMAYTWLRRNDMANYYFQRANEFDATGVLHVMANTLLLVREGRLDIARDYAYAAAQIGDWPTYWIDPVFEALEDEAQAGEALTAIGRAWDEEAVIPEIVLMVRTLLGDIDGAMDIARLLEGPGEEFATELLFIPEAAPLRRHPEFMPLLERLHIVEYWQEAGCEWRDDRLSC